MRCNLIATRISVNDMIGTQKMQRLFLSITDLAERARTLTTTKIRSKIKTEIDKYLGRGRGKRTTADEELLAKGILNMLFWIV